MKHLIDITDLNVKEIDELIETAKDIMQNKEKYSENSLIISSLIDFSSSTIKQSNIVFDLIKETSGNLSGT